jgi:hypothetical protein
MSRDEMQLTRKTEREICQDQRDHRRLNEERLLGEVQNKKTVTLVVKVGKTISRHQNLTGFRVENAENSRMNPVPYMGCFLIHVERMRREKVTREETETVKKPDSASLTQLTERCRKCSPFFTLHL